MPLTDKTIFQIGSEFVGSVIKRCFCIYWQKLGAMQPPNELIIVNKLSTSISFIAQIVGKASAFGSF